MSVPPENIVICRVCTRNQPTTTSIFKTETFFEQPLAISEVITTCASVQVYKNDGLPERICNKCLDGLHQAYNFKKLCEKSDCELRNQLNGQFCYNKTIKTENDAWNDGPEFVSVDSSFTDEVKFKVEEHDINQEQRYGEEDKYEFEHPDGDIGNYTIGTDDILDIKEDFTKYKNPNLYSDQSLEAHTKFHTDLECGKCGKQFQKLFQLNRHKWIHLKSKPFKCDVCDAAFFTSNKLIIHKRLHSRKSRETTRRNSHVSINCKLCGKQLNFGRNSKKFIDHMNSHSNIRKYKCDICNKAYLHSSSLKNHQATHGAVHQCDVCEAKFSDGKALLTHAAVHKGKKLYGCKVCGKQYTERSNLSKHKLVHTGDKRFECDICREKFFRKYSLVLHIRKHTGERPYKCEVCDKAFAARGTLTKHKKMHAREPMKN